MLSDKVKKFADEYLIDFNGTQAVIRAGYSKRSAKEQAARLLTNDNVQKYLTEQKAKLAKKHEGLKDRLIEELTKIAFFDIRKVYNEDGTFKNLSDLGDDEAAVIASLETHEVSGRGRKKKGLTKKFKTNPKVAAIERISKMLGYEAPTKVAPTDKEGNDLPVAPPQIVIAPNNFKFPGKEEDVS